MNVPARASNRQIVPFLLLFLLLVLAVALGWFTFSHPELQYPPVLRPDEMTGGGKAQPLFYRCKQDMVRSDEIIGFGEVLEVRTMHDEAVFMEVVRGRVMEYDRYISNRGLKTELLIPGITDEERETKRKEFRDYLLTEFSPPVTIIVIKKGRRGLNHWVFLFVDDRLWCSFVGVKRHATAVMKSWTEAPGVPDEETR